MDIMPVLPDVYISKAWLCTPKTPWVFRKDNDIVVKLQSTNTQTPLGSFEKRIELPLSFNPYSQDAKVDFGT